MQIAAYIFRRFPRVFVGIRGSFRGVSAGIREVSGMSKSLFFFLAGYPHFSADEVSGSVANSSVSSTFRRFLVSIRRSFRGVSAGVREVSGMHPGSCIKRCFSQGIRTVRRMRCQDLSEKGTPRSRAPRFLQAVVKASKGRTSTIFISLQNSKDRLFWKPCVEFRKSWGWFGFGALTGACFALLWLLRRLPRETSGARSP